MNIGLFINNVISFLIVAFVLFMAIKAMNQLRRKQEEEPANEPPPSRGDSRCPSEAWLGPLDKGVNKFCAGLCVEKVVVRFRGTHEKNFF